MATSGDEETLVLLCAAFSNTNKKRRKPRSTWVRKWIARRERAGAFNSLVKEIEIEDPRALKNFLRMDKFHFEKLLDKLTPIIQRTSTLMRESIPAGEKLALNLRFLASGDSYASLEYLYRIPKNTISKFVPEVCEAIWNELQQDYVSVPDTQEKWKKIQEEFFQKWQFPHCIGAIDGKHIAIKAPANTGSQFYNYKKFFSILLLALVDASCKFFFC